MSARLGCLLAVTMMIGCVGAIESDGPGGAESDLSFCALRILGSAALGDTRTSYTLTASTCGQFNIARDGFVFDCQGHTIDGVSGYEAGIRINGAHNVTIRNCVFTGHTIAGVQVWNGNNTLIENSEVHDTPGSGGGFILGVNTHGSRLYNSRAINTFRGISVNLSTGNVIDGNRVYWSRDDEIEVNDSPFTTVSNNIVESSQVNGIELSSRTGGCSDSAVWGNSVGDNRQNGISVEGSSRVYAIANQTWNNGRIGLKVTKEIPGFVLQNNSCGNLGCEVRDPHDPRRCANGAAPLPGNGQPHWPQYQLGGSTLPQPPPAGNMVCGSGV